MNSDDTINPGDRVSWKYSNKVRQFGKVLAETGCSDDLFRYRAFRVKDDDGKTQLIPAYYITKEVG